MIFDIDDIPDGGLDFKLVLQKDQLEIDHEDSRLNEDVAVEGTLSRVKKDIYLRGMVRTGLDMVCSRCLSPMTHKVDAKLVARFAPPPSDGFEEEREMAEHDPELEFYSDNRVDIAHAVHDAILLDAPMVGHCKEDCLGLCSHCGQNLNLGPCSCHGTGEIDPRLEILNKLKSNLK